MRPIRLRSSVAIAVAALTLTTTLAVGAVGQDASSDGLCSLLSVDEVAAALGTEVEAEGTSDEWVSTCTWTPIDLDSYGYLYAEWSAGTADGLRDSYPELTEVEVGGHPAFSDIGQLFIVLDAGVLRLDGAPEEGDDQGLLTELGELAITRAESLPTPTPIDVPDPTAVGRYPIGDAFCALFTTEEVGNVVGAAFDAAPDEMGCTWSSNETGELSTLTADWTRTTLAEHRAAWPDGEDITVGGKPAYYSPGLFLNELLIEADPGVLYLVITGYDGDVRAALTELGELAVSRSGSLLPPPEPEPEPTVEAHADATLESMLPDSIGGETLSISSVSFDSIGAQMAPDTSDALQGMLADQGKTLDDVSLVFAGTISGTSILGVRVAGGDASTLAPVLFGSVAGDQSWVETAATVAGKEVQVLTLGTDTAYYYVTGDTAWFVDAEEPALTEVFEALP